MALDHDSDRILGGAHRGTHPDHAAGALAHCARVLDGDALAEVVAMLGLGGAMTTCAVSTWDIHASGQQFRHTVYPCGLPTTSGLCAHHEAERARLSERGES